MKKVIFFILLIFLGFLYYLINSSIYDNKKNNSNFFSDIIPLDIRQSIKYYFFPYRIIENQKYIIKSILDANINDKKIPYLDMYVFEYDIKLKENLKNLIFKKNLERNLLINNNISNFVIYSSKDKPGIYLCVEELRTSPITETKLGLFGI